MISLLLALAPLVGDLCPTSPNSVGVGAFIGFQEQDPAEESVFTVVEAPPDSWGLVLYSTSVQPPMPFGDGRLCLWMGAAHAGKFRGVRINSLGEASFSVGDGQRWNQPTFLPGYYAQFVYRDTVGAGVNLSNSIQAGAEL